MNDEGPTDDELDQETTPPNLGGAFVNMHLGIPKVAESLDKIRGQAAAGMRFNRAQPIPPPKVKSPGSFFDDKRVTKELAEMAAAKRAEHHAEVEREEAMVSALEGVLGALREQAAESRHNRAVQLTMLLFAFLAWVAAVVAIAWTISSSWEWTTGSGLAAALIAGVVAWRLGALKPAA